MKYLSHILFAACLVAASSCVKEAQMEDSAKAPGNETVTIRVSMPENPYTKVDFTAQDSKLALAWEDTDCIRVISGSKSEVYTVSRIISDHEAEFTGAPVEGTSFDILYPGTYASVEEAQLDTTTPTQEGNGSVDHLSYKALLSGVDNYTEISFTGDWASAHGGACSIASVIKLQVVLPEGVTTLKKASVKFGQTVYSLPLSNVDVSASGQVLTAYLLLPWNDILVPGGTNMVIYVTGTDNEVYSASRPIASDKTILSGRMNTIKGIHLVLSDFTDGDGTEENPYLIANTRQLGNMMALYKDSAAPANKNEFKKYFLLIEDIDASTLTWTPLNSTGSFYKAIDFDGCGHTISGLTSNGTYASFAGVLYGSVRNVTFDGATISGTSKKGVVAGFLGTTGLPGNCENVTVINSTVSGSNYSGGFAGHVRSTGSITGCRVENTTVSSTSGHVGGFAAYTDITGDDKYEVPARFIDCHVVDVSVNQDYTTDNDEKVCAGGFIARTEALSAFTGCTVKATVTANKAAVKDIGGFVGRTSGGVPNFNGCQVLAGTTVTAKAAHVGGFAGYSEVAASYTDCTSAATVENTSEYTGGFVGFAAGASAFTGCTASGNVSSTKHAGGFVGTAENSSFTDCTYKDGTVTENFSGKSQSGGFCGFATTGVSFRGCTVKNATFASNSGTYVGGFIGQEGNSYNGSNNVSITQCHVEGTSVTGSTNCGGFVGVQYDNISASYVSGGTVTARNAHCGGFSAFVQNGNLLNCYTTTSVQGGSYAQVGGMVGIAYTTNISYCYSAGSISASGTDRGAFVGKCEKQGSNPVASISNCIAWDSSLPFCGTNTVGASITDVYAGTAGSVTSQATAQNWPTSAWSLTGTLPTLLETPFRIPAVFIGDSITWQWARTSRTEDKSKILIPIDPLPSYMTISGNNVTTYFHPGFFSGNGYIDKGVSGQNTTQMLDHFRKDVIDLNPVAVVIMGGTNDLAQGFSESAIRDNIAAMAQMADDAGIKVVICSVTPCNNSSSRLSNPNTKGVHIITLNGLLKEYAESNGFAWCNYWDSMVADDGLALHPDYCLYDYLHPGPDGYDVMESILQPILTALL